MDEQRDIPAFDAYGERLPAMQPRALSTLERRMRTAGVAVFWSLALLIVAGRLHWGPVTGAPMGQEAQRTVEMAAR